MSDDVDKIRDAIGERATSLDALAPEALDVAAEVVAVLHEQLAGRASGLNGHRSPKTRRQQLRGEDALTIEDLSFLTIHAPRALALALLPMLRRAGYGLEPLSPAGPQLGEAKARVAEAMGALQAAMARTEGSAGSRQVLAHELPEARRRLAELEAAISAAQERRAA